MARTLGKSAKPQVSGVPLLFPAELAERPRLRANPQVDRLRHSLTATL